MVVWETPTLNAYLQESPIKNLMNNSTVWWRKLQVQKWRDSTSGTLLMRSHHKPTERREWCGLNEWPPTWHCAALSPAGTGRAPLCWICVISTNTWHSPAAMLSHFIPRRCPNTQSTKEPKEALISPIYTCQMGGGTCCVVYQLVS